MPNRGPHHLASAAKETGIPEGVVWQLVADNPYLTTGGLIPHENLTTLRELYEEATTSAR
jgi:hypothetical protein